MGHHREVRFRLLISRNFVCGSSRSRRSPRSVCSPLANPLAFLVTAPIGPLFQALLLGWATKHQKTNTSNLAVSCSYHSLCWSLESFCRESPTFTSLVNAVHPISDSSPEPSPVKIWRLWTLIKTGKFPRPNTYLTCWSLSKSSKGMTLIVFGRFSRRWIETNLEAFHALTWN